MPFTKNQTKDRDELYDLVYGWGKVVTRRAFGEAGPGLDLDFDTTYVSRDLSIVIQALVVLAVASQAGMLSLWKRVAASKMKREPK